MPFIQQERREKIRNGSLLWCDFMPGDKCYYFYKRMVDGWKANPRWTTAHEIYKQMLDDCSSMSLEKKDDWIAYELAWQVFFIKYVMPYEDEKREENGDI